MVQKDAKVVIAKQESTPKIKSVIQKKADEVADAQEVTAEAEKQIDNSLKYVYKPEKE